MDKKIHLVAADMGYGHQRAAFPLFDLSGGEIITINNYPGIPEKERDYWLKSLKSYEKISRLKKVPLLGKAVFSLMDAFQKIKPFYPFRDLSAQTIQQKFFRESIEDGLGRTLIEELNKDPLPFVTTFFVAAYIAEYHGYKGEIYCIICDADVSRAWAPLYPQNSRTNFLAPNERVKERLVMYGVKQEKIFITGFPLPETNVGEDKSIIKQDLAKRLSQLDPSGNYRQQYQALIEDLETDDDSRLSLREKKGALNITFAVGGAGAQKEIGRALLDRLASGIKSGAYHLNLVAGSRPEVKDYFIDAIRESGLSEGNGVDIFFSPDKFDYFRLFNKLMRQTDILWTKPSELSFYAGLGLPIIMASPVGSQEDFNREWLLSVGAGIDNLDPRYVDEWLPDILESGRLARAAMDGFLNAESLGTYNIKKLILKN